MPKTIAKGIELDAAENAAVNEFVAVLDEQQFDPKPLLLSLQRAGIYLHEHVE